MKKLLLFLALLGALPAVTNAKTAAIPQKMEALKWPAFRQIASKKRTPEIKAIQYLLRSRGFYKAPIDGVFGAQTTKSVRAFQLKNGLKADGIVAAQTFSKLIRTLKRGDKGDAVRALQTLLREPMAEDGTRPFERFSVDGVFGSGTDNLLRNYQREWVGYPETNVLKSDGIAGPKTWYYLFGGQLNY